MRHKYEQKYDIKLTIIHLKYAIFVMIFNYEEATNMEYTVIIHNAEEGGYWQKYHL